MEIKKHFSSKAQTVTELAVFGAMLIFVVGLIVRYSVNYHYGQNQQVKAMRLALGWSFSSGQEENLARQTASIYILDDRQDASLNQFGSQERAPYVVSGSGSFTKNLYLRGDWGETNAEPLMDLVVNGQHFPLTTAQHRKIVVGVVQDEDSKDAADHTVLPCLGVGNPSPKCNMPINYGQPVGSSDPTYSIPYTPGQPDTKWHVWYDNCYARIDRELVWNGASPSTKKTLTWFPCVAFYSKIANSQATLDNAGDPRYCKSADECNEECDSHAGVGMDNKDWCMSRIEDRFDLDRDPLTSSVPPDLWGTFAWQWYRTAGITSLVNFETAYPALLDVDADGKEETILAYKDNFGTYTLSYRLDKKEHAKELFGSRFNAAEAEAEYQKYCVGSWDNPRSLTACTASNVIESPVVVFEDTWESIVPDRFQSFMPEQDTGSDSTIIEFLVMDAQEGDWDLTYDDESEALGIARPGIRPQQIMYTTTRLPDGSTTYLEIVEEKGADGKQQTRHTQKTNRIDLIERQIQLSKATGNLCQDTYPTKVLCCHRGAGGGDWQDCGCKDEGNLDKTCFDYGSRILYVRSKVQDTRARRTITPVER